MYYLSEPNGVCTDVGATTIASANECRSAISKIPGHNTFRGSHTMSHMPKGCYLYTPTRRAYWNNHEIGSPDWRAHQVCDTRPLGSKFVILNFLIN